MNYSKRIIDQSKSPKYRFEFKSEHELRLKLEKNNSAIQIFYNTKTISDEICFEKVSYQTNLNTEYLGILDALVGLMHGRPIEAIDRFPAKELDHYLRDNSQEPALTAYDEKFYEVLGLGEELKKSHFNISKDHSPKLYCKFLDMSVSEQLDFVEEVFSHYIYGTNSEFSKLEIIDVEDEVLYFDGLEGLSHQQNEKLLIFLRDKLQEKSLVSKNCLAR